MNDAGCLAVLSHLFLTLTLTSLPHNLISNEHSNLKFNTFQCVHPDDRRDLLNNWPKSEEIVSTEWQYRTYRLINQQTGVQTWVQTTIIVVRDSCFDFAGGEFSLGIVQNMYPDYIHSLMI
jgi:hypothetical protein